MRRLAAFLVILVVMVSAWTSVSLAGDSRRVLRQRVSKLEVRISTLEDFAEYVWFETAVNINNLEARVSALEN